MVTQFIGNRKPNWRNLTQPSGRFNKITTQIDRLMLLGYAWNTVVGEKQRFWVLEAVQAGTLFVKVKAAVAKNELVGRRRALIQALNKYFDKPWIKHIEIQ